MTPWDQLSAELDRWGEAGLRATCWWRDDDAIEPTGALERMLEIAERHRAPLALAVIPARTTDALAVRLDASHLTDVCVHGWRHQNHAPANDKKAEFGSHRPVSVMLAEAAAGLERLNGLPRLAPLFVPPWNRIANDLTSRLAECGYESVSTFGPRKSACASPGLYQVNTHADLIDWHGGRGFAGDDAVLAQIVRHLRDRRSRKIDFDEPTGVLSHHLVHDIACWSFLDSLFALLAKHPAAQFVRCSAWQAGAV